MMWKSKKIGELCTLSKGNIGISKAIKGEYPLVVTSEERKSHNEFQFDDEAVVIPLVSSTGHGHRSLKRIHYQTGKFSVGSILCAVISKDKSILNTQYLFRYLFLNKERELVSRMRGMANVSLPMKEIAEIEVPLPPLEEQLKFVEEYSLLEQSKNELDIEISHQLSLVKQLRQAFLREAMQGKLSSEWRGNHPELVEGSASAAVLLEKIKAEREQLIKEKKIKKQKPLPPVKEDEIPFEIPKSWVWTSIEYFAANEPNALKAGPFGSSLKKEFYTRTGYKIYGQEQVIKNDPNFGDYYIDEKRFNSLKSCAVKPGDILISLVGTMGKVLILPAKIKKGIINPRLVKLSLFEEINRDFFKYFLYSKVAIEQINHYSHGSTMNIINLSILKRLIVPLPPVFEQKRIVAKLNKLMQYCNQLEESIKNSQQQNEMLLQQVLREALEPKVSKIKTLKKCDASERAILAGHIINLTNNENFGRVKFQKLLHLAEYHCKIDLGSNYIQKVAGPYDGEMINDIESTLKRFRYYTINKKQGKVNYVGLGSEKELDTLYQEKFSKEAKVIDDFLSIFKNAPYDQCEIVSTLYAVWNNRIIKQQEVTDDLLIEDFLKWDSQKAKYKKRLTAALDWMKKEKIVPSGWGRLIEKAKA